MHELYSPLGFLYACRGNVFSILPYATLFVYFHELFIY